MILVTGSTGAFGSNAIDYLLEKGLEASMISALVRDLEKAEDLKNKGIQVRKGDYNDYGSLVSAFQGVDKLLFVSGSDIEIREAQHQNLVKAAKEAKVNHIVYTSFVRKENIENSEIGFLQDTHIKTEQWIKESGITYTILQNALYMDMIPMFVGEAVAESGMIALPAESGRCSSVLRTELAEVAANILVTKGHENKTYALANMESASYEDVAKAISEAIDRDVEYHSPSVEEFKIAMEENGVPPVYIGLFTSFSIAQAKGELELTDATLENLLGRKPITTSEFIQQTYRQ